jgi:oligosaccharyltransferase complex subunit gamma
LQEVRKSGKSGVFFVDLEFKESKSIFHRLGVQSLPWIVHVNPNVAVGADGVIKFKQDDTVSAALYLDRLVAPPLQYHAKRVSSHAVQVCSKALKFGDSCWQMRHDDYGHHHWKAEDMAAFLRDKTGINIEKVDRPSFSRSGLFPVVFLAAVLALGAIAYNLYYAEFMKNLVLWTMGVLFVYWFSVSGGMHNIIRGVPLYYPDQEGKIKVSPAGVLSIAMA